MPKKQQVIALVNVHGPIGELVLAGEPIPEDWPEEVKLGLINSGGAADEREATKTRKETTP